MPRKAEITPFELGRVMPPKKCMNKLIDKSAVFLSGGRKAFRLSVLCGMCTIASVNAQTSVEDSILNQFQIKEIAVNAPLQQPTGNHVQVKADQLAVSNTGQNLPYLLQMTPSLITTSDDGLGVGYTYFRVRGSDHTRINMTVDDVPLNDSESQTVFWVNMTDMASSLTSLDVQRGVGTSKNGSSAFGASVNMQTMPVEPVTNHFELAFNGGMYNTFREMVSAQIALPNSFYAKGRFSKVNSDGFLYRAASDLYSYSGAVGYMTRDTRLELSLLGGKERTYMAWDGVSYDVAYGLNGADRRYNPAGAYVDDEGNEAYYKNQTDNYAQQHARLHLTQRLTDRLWLNAALHYTHGSGYYEQYKAGKKFSAFGLPSYVDSNGNEVKRSDFVRLKNLGNHFYGGILSLRWLTDNVESRFGGAVSNYQGQHWGNITYIRDSLYPHPLPLDYEYYRSTGDKLDANVYAKANWHIINRQQEKLTLYGDLQYRYVDYRIDGINDEDLQPIPVHERFHFFNPKAGCSYSNRGHQTWFNFAIANREPSRKNYTEAGVHDIPRPERLYDYELGYLYTHRIFSLGANLYFMDYDNQLVLTGKYSDTGAFLTRNVKDSYRMGIELTGGVMMVNTANVRFRWDGNLTLSRNRILNYTDWFDVYDSNWDWQDNVERNLGEVTIAFSPSVTFGSFFDLNVYGVDMNIQTIVVSKQYLDNTMNEDAAIKPYTVTNLNLQYCFDGKRFKALEKGPAVTLRCQVNNLFDSKYASNGGNYASIVAGQFTASPWYYAQAGINVHAGFIVSW